MTITELKKEWDDAPTLQDKDVLVAKALGHKTHILNEAAIGDRNVLLTPCSDEVGEWCSPLPRYTTDPAAALQATKEVGISRWDICFRAGRKYYVEVYDAINWEQKSNPNQGCSDLRRIAFKTVAEACGFAVYAFSELKEGAER